MSSMKKPLLTIQNIKVRYTSAKNIWMITKNFGIIFCGLTQKWNFLSTAADSVMVWVSWSASGPGHFAVIDGTMNSALYKNISKENVQPSVHDPKQ